MMNQGEALLLSQHVHYYENCPGCKVDKEKAEKSGPPWLRFFFIWLLALCASLPTSSIFPYLYYMIRDFHIAEREEDINFYAGFEGSAFLIGRTLTAIPWGLVADRYGRKPVMILGCMAVVIFNTLFGLSTSYWMALATRFLVGALCGILGPIKAYVTEVSRREHQALGMSLIGSAWGLGLVVGPAIGGYLAQPAEKYPHIFSHESIFGRFPYSLVNLVISIFSLLVCVASFWLPETLHMHHDGRRIQDQPHDLEDTATPASDDDKKPEASKTGSKHSLLLLLKNWPFMSTVIVNCIFNFQGMAFYEVFSLWGVSPRTFGGLDLSTDDIGNALAVSGAGLLLYQMLLYPLIERTFGVIQLVRIGAVIIIALVSGYPFMSLLSGWRLYLLIDVATMLRSMLSVSIITGLILLQNRAVSQELRGAANGLSMCADSFCSAAAPAAAGLILTWAESRRYSHFLPGSHMVFFCLNVITLIGFGLTFKPFLAEPDQEFS